MTDDDLLDDVEAALCAELDGATLVGEIDLDVWGSLAEEALRTVVGRRAVARIANRWPATYVTYLVHQGIHQYDEKMFWENVTIVEMRGGPEAGPGFERALRVLDLPTFDDLEAQEGFDKHTRGRYVRRIHLHGGLPRNAVPRTLALLAATLRQGARTGQEVLSMWASMDLYVHLRSKAAQRLFAYTGEFGVTLVEQLIALMRGDEGAALRAPNYIAEEVEYFLANPPDPVHYEFTLGPKVLLGFGAAPGPVLVVPTGPGTVWSVDAEVVGEASRQAELAFPLAPPRGATSDWTVSGVGEGGIMRRFFSSVADAPVFIFDERRVLLPRATTLRGVRAYVLAPDGAKASGTIDTSAAADGWDGYFVATVDLRGQERLHLGLPDAEGSEIAVESALAVRLVGTVVEGVRTADGLDVLAGSLGLTFSGYVPDVTEVEVTVNDTTRRLADLREHDGVFALEGLVPAKGAARCSVVVTRDREDPIELAFSYVPGLRFPRPSLVAPDAAIELVAAAEVVGSIEKIPLRFPEGTSTAEAWVAWEGVDHDLVFSITRLSWFVEGGGAAVFGADPVQLRLDDLRRSVLHLRTEGVRAKVMLSGAGAAFEEWAKSDLRRPGVASLPLRGLVETVKASAAPRVTLTVLGSGEPSPIEIGVIEARYEPLGVDVDFTASDDLLLLSVSWTELSEWEKRTVRLWGDTGDDPLVSIGVEPGATSVEMELPAPSPGRYLIEVGLSGGWGKPPRPQISPGCVTRYIGSDEAVALRAAVLSVDKRREFADDLLDGLTPLLADLMQELLPVPGLRDQHVALLERIADDHWRTVEVLNDLADRFEVGEHGERSDLLDPLLMQLLPLMFDFPIRSTDDRGAVRLEHLWVIAPLAAVCLDACDKDPRGHERWKVATGVSSAPARDVSAGIDRLLRGAGRSGTVGDSASPVLSPTGWALAIKEIHTALRTRGARAWQAKHRRLIGQLLDSGVGGGSPRWRSVPNHLRPSVRDAGEAGEMLVGFVALALAHLDWATDVALRGQILSATETAIELWPRTSRLSFVVAAASLRVLEAAGGLENLVT